MAKCYECVHRRGVPGDAHSRCAHPLVGPQDGSDMFTAIISMISAGAGAAAQKMGVAINPHGIRMGWACWPVNFDPIWIERCDAFTPKNPEKKDAQT